MYSYICIHMCMYMCVYIYIFIYVYICMYICVYVLYLYIFIHTYLHLHIHTYASEVLFWACVYMHIFIYIFIYACTQTHVRVCFDLCVCIITYPYMYQSFGENMDCNSCPFWLWRFSRWAALGVYTFDESCHACAS